MKTDKAKEEALTHSNKQVGKLVNKGWFNGAEIDVVSPNVMNEYVGHDKGVKHFWVSKDERLIYSASDDQTINIWDLVKGTILGTMRVSIIPSYFFYYFQYTNRTILIILQYHFTNRDIRDL